MAGSSNQQAGSGRGQQEGAAPQGQAREGQARSTPAPASSAAGEVPESMNQVLRGFLRNRICFAR